MNYINKRDFFKMTMNPARFKETLAKEKIILSVSKTLKEKETTFDFKKTELTSLSALMDIMNNNAVSSGLFFDGHRNKKHMKAMGNIYFIDIDSEPKEGEKPYYLEIENKLRELNISFVSVPSKSADEYSYKRHIAVVLKNYLPVKNDEYIKAVNEIVNKIGIDLNKIDSRVKENQYSFLAPCIINKNFKNYNDKSYFYNGNPLELEENKNIQSKENVVNDGTSIEPDILIKFVDGTVLSSLDAKILIAPGTKKECYCPKHKDDKPSATFYHNESGGINIFCSVCKNIKISKKIIKRKPRISHYNWNYSIIIEAKNKKIENNLKIILGINYQKLDNRLIWSYTIDEINDIFLLMLVKIQLINDGYSLLNLNINNRYLFAEKQLLREYSKNTKPINIFINKKAVMKPSKMYYAKVSNAVFENYIFPELTIYEAYQAYPEINSMDEICNKGLAYLDFVLSTREKEKNVKLQKDKKFPSRLSKEKKEISNKDREIKRMKTVTASMNEKEKKIYKLIESKKYNKKDGELNITALSKAMKISRTTLYKYLESINSKKNKN